MDLWLLLWRDWFQSDSFEYLWINPENITTQHHYQHLRVSHIRVYNVLLLSHADNVNILSCDQQGGWYPNPVSKTCIKLFLDTTSQTEASATCQNINAELVSFPSQEARDVFYNLLQDSNTGKKCLRDGRLFLCVDWPWLALEFEAHNVGLSSIQNKSCMGNYTQPLSL